ncbi:MAG: endonuclease III [Betaproteobacteria bacterium]
MNKQQIEPFFQTLQQVNPHPQTELEYTSVFELLCAVLMSAQATDVSVNKVTRVLFKVANTPEKLFKLGLPRLEEYIKTIGLYKSKAKHLIQTSKILMDQFNSQVPKTREELESLPGVGRKTANVVLNCAFNEPTIAVDTHIFRVSNRVGLAKGKTPLEVEKGLLKRIPIQYQLHAHHWLILHGRYVCKARSPLCQACGVSGYCDHAKKATTKARSPK